MYDTIRSESAVSQQDIKISARDVQVFYGEKQAIKDLNVEILDKLSLIHI